MKFWDQIATRRLEIIETMRRKETSTVDEADARAIAELALRIYKTSPLPFPQQELLRCFTQALKEKSTNTHSFILPFPDWDMEDKVRYIANFETCKDLRWMRDKALFHSFPETFYREFRPAGYPSISGRKRRNLILRVSMKPAREGEGNLTVEDILTIGIFKDIIRCQNPQNTWPGRWLYFGGALPPNYCFRRTGHSTRAFRVGARFVSDTYLHEATPTLLLKTFERDHAVRGASAMEHWAADVEIIHAF